VLKKYWPFLAIALLLFGLFGALDVLDLRGEEPRRALVALEMLLRNDYLMPTIQDWPYYNKPPLFNWVLIAAFKLAGGFQDWVVRLPSLLAFVAMAAIHFKVVSQWLNTKIALWSFFFILTAVHHLFFATVLGGELDLFYALIVYVQTLALFYGYQRKEWLLLFSLSYLLLGIGFLTKGLPSIVFQAMTLLGLAYIHKQWKWLFSWQHILGALLGLIPVACFFGLYESHHGKAMLYLFNLLEEAAQKSAGERSLLDIFIHLFTFPLQFFVDHLPWTLALFLLPWRNMYALIKGNAFLQFAFLFIVFNIWIYWISPGTRQRYLYMFLPFVSVILAAFFQARTRKIPERVIMLLVLTLAVGRITYNYTLLPYQQRTMKSLQRYREIQQAALDASNGGPIHTFGLPDTIYVNPSIAGISLMEDTIYIPQYYPYQIPLKLALAKGEIIPYDTIAQAGITYLTTDSLIADPSAKIYYRKMVWDEKELKVLEFKQPVRPVPKE
jgi:4-amino-4-deoxy-L-arabinose transferase-like glycosyltransferase